MFRDSEASGTFKSEKYIMQAMRDSGVSCNIEDAEQIVRTQILPSLDPRLSKIEALNLMAIKCFEAGLINIAVRVLHDALSLDGQDSDTLFNLGYMFYTIGEGQRALEILRKLKEPDQEAKSLISLIESQLYCLGTDRIDQSSNLSFIEPGCDIRKPDRILFGEGVIIQRDCWVNIAYDNPEDEFMIVFGEGTNVGRRCTISASNKIVFGKNVLRIVIDISMVLRGLIRDL